MGKLQAEEMVAHGGTSYDVLEWHLRSNHYPPVPLVMLPVARAAINACNEGDYDRPIPLPEGVEYRKGRDPTAYEVAESFHLDAFLASDTED